MPSANAKWYRGLGDALLVLSEGDLPAWSGDAVVNAANERMLGGGGVDGAIHRAAGPKLLEYCQQVPEVAPNVRCPTGEARITRGGRLQARYVIHTVGPVYESDEESSPLLAAAYKSSLALANKHRLENVAFPAISTGVYGYPKDKAAQVALQAVKESIGNVKYVEFVLFDQKTLDIFTEAADSILEPMPVAAPAASEEPQQQPTQSGTASLHPSSQAAQPTASNSQSDSVCGGAKAAGGADNEVTSARPAAASNAGAAAGGAASNATGTAPSGTADGGKAPSAAAGPSGTVGTHTTPSEQFGSRKEGAA